MERKSSSEGTSTSTAGCLGLVQEGFAEGIVSLKEAAVYISLKDNRFAGDECNACLKLCMPRLTHNLTRAASPWLAMFQLGVSTVERAPPW